MKSAKQKHLDRQAIAWLEKYLRYVNYLGAAQLYLKDNFLLRRELTPNDIKERILGHWGTVPGLNYLYAHLNYLIFKHGANILYLAGPGHGAPAVIANLFAENTLAAYYPKLQRNKKGAGALIKMFSWPGGFPSHTNPGTPGVILEGGELGYSLATAFGAVLDNPDLIVACVIGDGEAETGPLAAAWHSNKFLNPKESGAVLPLLHANGYKISGPAIYATMSDKELTALFTGFGYNVKIIDNTHPQKPAHQNMIDTLEWAYQNIRSIQKKARKQKAPVLKAKWPLIIYRSLKGATGIKSADQHKVEGSCLSHGIPLHDPKTNAAHFKLIKDWLTSYRITELVDTAGRPLKEVLRFVPTGNARMGMNKHANGGNLRKNLHLPDLKKYAVKISTAWLSTRSTCQTTRSPTCYPSHNTGTTPEGTRQIDNTSLASNYIRDIFILNKKTKNFRFMCPDETESNKFQSLFAVTKRAYLWPVHAHDKNLSPEGRVMEILSEHTLQGWLQGYLLTGRHGIFATYEAFATIVASMVDQHAKFIKQSTLIPWRKPVSALNYLLTSVGWRQEHNGYSHQNPSFISNVLEKHGKFCSVYFPADANQLLVTLEDCFKRTNSINIIVANKNPMPQWLTIKDARRELKKGIAIWEWINPASSKKPDVVFAAAGDVMVQETIAAISILRKTLPELKIRFVNVSEVTALGIGDERHPLSISDKEFNYYFTKDRPIIFNFHGYPGVIKKLIFGHTYAERFSIHGYMEEGTTTTPFDMMVMNKTSRYHLLIDAIEKIARFNTSIRKKMPGLIKKFKHLLRQHSRYIIKYGKDMAEIE